MPSWMPYIWNPFVARPASYSSFLIIFAAAWLVVATLISTIIFCGFSFTKGKFKAIWPLTLLRAGTLLAVGILSIPIGEVFLTVLDCHDGVLQLYPDVACFTTAVHLVPFILSTLVYVDGNPSALKNPHTRAQGRTDMLYLLIKFIIVFVWQFVASSSTKLGLLVVCLLIITKEMVEKQPLHNEAMQATRSGICFAALISATVALIFDLTVSKSADTIVPFVTLVTIMLPAIGVGAFVNRFVKQRIARRVYTRLQGRIQEMTTLPRRKASFFASAEAKSSVGGGGLDLLEQSDPATTLGQLGTNIWKLTTEKPKAEIPIFDSPYEVELACRFIRGATNPSVYILMREIFEAAIVQYPKVIENQDFGMMSPCQVPNVTTMPVVCFFTKQNGLVHMSAIFYLLAFPSQQTLLVRPEETNAERAEELLEKVFKMNIAFDIRFMGFVCRKLAEQSQKSKEMQKSELNVSSYVEAFSQEKYAKTYNILRLFADFNRTVLADLEESRRFADRANELEDPNYSNEDLDISDEESLQESHKPREGNSTTFTPNARKHNDGNFHGVSDMENRSHEESSPQSRISTIPVASSGPKAASSHGGSSTASESREARRARMMRNEFVTRLKQVPQTFELRLKVLSIMCLALAALGIGYANSVFASVSSGVDEFIVTTDLGRTAVAMVQAARLMSYFGSVGDTSNHDMRKKDLANLDDKLGNVTLPYINQRSADRSSEVRIRTAYQPKEVQTRAAPEIVYQNQYEISNRIDEYARSLLAQRPDYYRTFPPSNDYRIRYLVENMINIGETMKAVCDVGEAEFTSMISRSLVGLWAILIILVLVFLLKVVLVWLPLLRDIREIQLRYLKILPTISKKILDEVLLVIDEQLEVLNDDGAQVQNASTADDDATRREHERKELVNYTGGRKFMTKMTLTLAYEVAIGDNATWTFGEPEMYMKDLYEKLHENSITGRGDREITPTTAIPILNDILATDGCTASIGCDPDVRRYNASFGFTYDAVTAPLDQLIFDYIRNAKLFYLSNALKATRNFLDDNLLFMANTEIDIVDGLLLVDQLILKSYLPERNNLALSASFCLFIFSIVMFVTFYVFIYRRVIASHVMEMETVVMLMHILPLMGQPVPEKLSRLIQTGGASIGEED
ncbi:hypothetical protein HDU93_007184 [Gonapodya sp. JEL0774]|nr:hypothetical protein HDU93_007184 [Gonapodya sp. JEL0774]